jgi:hypothetical protein
VLVAAETVNLIGVKYATNTSPVSSLSWEWMNTLGPWHPKIFLLFTVDGVNILPLLFLMSHNMLSLPRSQTFPKILKFCLFFSQHFSYRSYELSWE